MPFNNILLMSTADSVSYMVFFFGVFFLINIIVVQTPVEIVQYNYNKLYFFSSLVHFKRLGKESVITCQIMQIYTVIKIKSSIFVN